MTRLRLAVIGAGHLGKFHSRLVKDLPDVEFVGVADPIAGPREALAAECQTAAVADYRELLGRIDAAIVAAPTRLHHEIGLTLLNAGVHVLMEKPVAATVAEADDLVAAARQAGVVLQVGHIERFNPALADIHNQILAPKYIEAARYSNYTFRSTDVGVVLDLMIHDLDAILSLVRSPVRQVQALGLTLLGPHEDVAQARIEFENGCLADVSASRVSYQPQRRMQIWSPELFASVDYSTRESVVVKPSETLRPGKFHADQLSTEAKTRLKETFFEELFPISRQVAQQRNALLDEQLDFVECIRQARSPRVPGEQGRDALALAEQVLRSIDSHAWDGTSTGRFGPLAEPRPAILHGPHWDRAPVTRREAG